MLHFTLKMNNLEEGKDGGGKVVPPPVTTEDATDEFGYAKAPVATIPPVTPSPAAPALKVVAPPPAEEIKNAVSGYGKEPEVIVDDPPVIPPVEQPKVDLGYEIETKDLDPKEALKIKEFAKTHSLTKEAAQAFANMRFSESQAVKQAELDNQKRFDKEIAETKANWHKELKTHPTFGGEKFDHNVLQVEKLLTDHLPETKKVLTERKSMLPPYVMRDLAKFAEHLYSTEKMVQGDPQITDKPIDEEYNHLDFYKS